MNKSEQIKQLSALFLETGQAHHRAFFEVDGFDPEWPMWYASLLQEKLTPILGNEITQSEIIYSLVALSKKQPKVAPGIPWNDYYAEHYSEQYG